MLHRLAAVVLACALAPASRAGLELWDTGKTSADPLAPAALEAKTGWTKVAAETGEIKGDAVLSNGRLTAVIRRNGAVDLHSALAARARVVLQGPGGAAVTRLDRIA